VRRSCQEQQQRPAGVGVSPHAPAENSAGVNANWALPPHPKPNLPEDLMSRARPRDARHASAPAEARARNAP
jgi:hypothetical protein